MTDTGLIFLAVLFLGFGAMVVVAILASKKKKPEPSIQPQVNYPGTWNNLSCGPRIVRAYHPPAVISDDSGFVEGLIIGEMMSQPTVINETTVIEEEAPSFSGFSGGDSGGGGATSSWDSSGSSYSDSSSSDSGSSDY